MSADPVRPSHLTYEAFKSLASDPNLSQHEKVGFPDSYRAGKTDAILADLKHKLRSFEVDGARVLDIGAGCGELAFRVIDHSREHRQTLVLVDSEEVLRQLPDGAGVTKVAGRFPDDTLRPLLDAGRRFDVILVYSVLHYVFDDADPGAFVDAALQLLDDGGEMLVGDIPNASRRARFFSSPAGVRFHRAFTGRQDDPPVVRPPTFEDTIDDAALIALMTRARHAGFDAYLMPQAADLPMANRREDLLFRRP